MRTTKTTVCDYNRVSDLSVTKEIIQPRTKEMKINENNIQHGIASILSYLRPTKTRKKFFREIFLKPIDNRSVLC